MGDLAKVLMWYEIHEVGLPAPGDLRTTEQRLADNIKTMLLVITQEARDKAAPLAYIDKRINEL